MYGHPCTMYAHRVRETQKGTSAATHRLLNNESRLKQARLPVTLEG